MAPGAKKCIEHMTVLTCANASGSFHLPLLVTGKLAKPYALKNKNLESSPLLYKNQKCTWMDVQLFQDWFFEEFAPQGKKFMRKNGLPEKAYPIS